MARTPGPYADYQEDFRTPRIVAAMAMIDRMDEIAGQLRRLNENLERQDR